MNTYHREQIQHRLMAAHQLIRDACEEARQQQDWTLAKAIAGIGLDFMEAECRLRGTWVEA